jgi:hypothetical protein
VLVALAPCANVSLHGTLMAGWPLDGSMIQVHTIQVQYILRACSVTQIYRISIDLVEGSYIQGATSKLSEQLVIAVLGLFSVQLFPRARLALNAGYQLR